jgi:sn-glycerol 3-phosphate transport system substrate-binding protein
MGTKTVIEAWLADLSFPGYMEPLYELGRQFERAHPEYTIEFHAAHYERLPAEVHAAVVSGRRPAVAEFYYSTTAVARDLLRPGGEPAFTSVEKAVGGRTEILGEPVVLDDIVPPIRSYYTHDGDLTSMPTVATTSLLYTNTSLLRAAGIDEIPRTWGELADACRVIARLPGGPSHGVTWANHVTIFQQALAEQGGLIVDRENGRAGRPTTVDLASKEMLAWATWWQRLHTDGHYLYTGKPADWPGTLRAFAEQRVVFRFSSSNDVEYMVEAAESGGFDLEVTCRPYNEEVPYAGNVIAGTSLWLGDGLDEATRDGALAFMQFLNNARNAADWHKANSFIPITNAAFELLEREGWFEQHPPPPGEQRPDLREVRLAGGAGRDRRRPDGHPGCHAGGHARRTGHRGRSGRAVHRSHRRGTGAAGRVLRQLRRRWPA